MLTHITYEEKIKRWAKELYNTDPKQVMKYGWKQWDDILGWIFGGELILLGGDSGSWKSTIINQICINVANQWFRVVKYSLENRLENAAKEELFYTCNRIRKNSGRQPYKRWPFISNEYWEKWKLYDKDFKAIMTEAYRQLSKIPVVELDKDQNVAIEDIVKLIESEVNNWTKLFVIDHLHYFVFDDVERLDLQIKNVMHQLNELARKYNIAIIMVAHYRNNTWREKWRDMKPNPTYFRDSSSLKQIAHKIIQLVREEDPNDYNKEITIFYFTKFRWPVQNLAIYGSFNQDLYEYEFWEPSIDIKKQEIVNSVPFAIDEDEKPF